MDLEQIRTIPIDKRVRWIVLPPITCFADEIDNIKQSIKVNL